MLCVTYRTTGVCMKCYLGAKHKQYFRGHLNYRAAPRPRKEEPWMALQRRQAAAAAAGDGVAAADPDVQKWAATLVEFLTQLSWGEGEKRKTGTVMVLAENGVWKAWVHDRDGKRAAWVSGGSLLDLVDSVDQGLANDSLTWKDDQPGRR